MEEEVSGESDSDEHEEIHELDTCRVPVQDLEALEHKAGRKRDNSDDVPPRKHEVSNGIFTACSGNASGCEPINAIGDDVGEVGGIIGHRSPCEIQGKTLLRRCIAE